MGWGDAFQVLGAGLGGAAQGLQYNDERKMREQEMAAKQEIARLQSEVRILLESMKETGRNTRHENPSGSVIAQQEGATERTGMTTDTQRDIATMNEAGRNYRWGQPSGNVTATNESRERVNRATLDARQAVEEFLEQGRNTRFNVGQATTRRGQDISAGTADKNRASAAQVAAENRASAERREQMRNRRTGYGAVDFMGDEPPPTTPDATTEVMGGTRKDLTPVEIVNPSSEPPPPRSPEASSDQVTRLGDQLKQAILRAQQAKDDAARAAARAEVKRLRDALAKALTQGGE